MSRSLRTAVYYLQPFISDQQRTLLDEYVQQEIATPHCREYQSNCLIRIAGENAINSAWAEFKKDIMDAKKLMQLRRR